MLISPKNFIKRYENASLDEIYKVKKSIMKFIREYESGKYDKIDHLRCPSYSSQYYNDKEILKGLNKLIEIKKQESGINDNNQLVDDLEKRAGIMRLDTPKVPVNIPAYKLA
ncbi:MAG: hypothetical protein K6A34_01735 [Methanobrevibacter sp.]|nr:hypothetical protein [Methanobrevibacter sp.]